MFSFINTFKKILSNIPAENGKKTVLILILLFAQSVLEVFSIAGVLPVLSSMTSSDPINDFWWAKKIAYYFNVNSKEELLLILTWILFIFICFKNVMSILIIKYINVFSFNVYRKLALKIANYIHDNHSYFINKKNSNEIVQDINRVSYYFAKDQLISSLYIITELLTFSVILSGLFLYEPRVFFLLVILVFPFIFLPYLKLKKLAVFLGEKRKMNEPQLEKSYREHIFGYIDITLTNSRNYFLKKIDNFLNAIVKIDINTNVISIIPSRIIESAIVLSLSVITTYSFIVDIKMGELINLLGLFAIAGFRITPSINRINASLTAINTTSWVMNSLNDFHFNDYNKHLINDTKLKFSKRISLNSATFHYENHKNLIFDDFSMDILKGESVGIIGKSGSGKTTLINVLLGVLSLKKGSLLLDDVIINDDTLKDYWKKIGYIKQDTFFINDSILKNVAFGLNKNEIDMDKFNYAINLAELSEFIGSLDLKENFIIKEGGSNISGGQRQRIGIARALYFDKEILFFDEATSALDEENQEKITLAIKKLSTNNITTVIISHRPSALKYCDKIIDLN